MSKHYKLLSSALVIAKNPGWRKTGGVALGAGSVVRLIPPKDADTSTVSSVTGCKNEPYVMWADVIGRVSPGWLARNTPLEATGGPETYSPYDPTDALLFWDRLREVLAVGGWSMQQWATSMKASDRSLARQVIRELGGSVPKTKDNLLLKEVLLRVTQAHTKEDQMAAAKKTKGAASAKPEATAQDESRSNSAMASCAAALRELNVKHGTVAKLEAEKCSSSALAELRDHINELALAAREGNKPGRASKLSAANRMVRKLQRKLAA